MTSWIEPNPMMAPPRVTPGHQATLSEAYRSGQTGYQGAFSAYSPVNAARDILQPYVDAYRLQTNQPESWFDFMPDPELFNPAEEAIRFGRPEEVDWSVSIGRSSSFAGLMNWATEHGKDYGLEPLDIETLKKQVGEQIRKRDAETQAMSQRTTGMSTVANVVGNFAGFGLDVWRDPAGHMALLIGGGGYQFAARGVVKEVGRRALQESLIGAGIEAWMQPQVLAWRQEYGLDYSWEHFRNAVALGAVAGAGFGAVLQSGARAYRGPIGKAYGRELGRQVKRTPAEAVHRKMLELDREAVLSGLRALEHAGVKTGDGAEVARMAEAGRETVEDNEFGYSLGDHAANVIEAEYSVHLDIPMAQRERPAPASPDDIHYHDNLDATVYRFNPADIEVDAKTFQFKKEGTDEFGVSQALAGVTKWDAIKAGQIVVYEFADGRRAIADGHQRLGLAKRITTQDPSQKPVIYGSLLREVDGITPDQARAIAAMKNIAEGTGSAIDAARVLRLDPKRLGELPPRSRLVSQARDLVDLSDEVFNAVENGVVPARYAAIVGRLVKDPDQQMAIMQVLAKSSPDNATQAESIVRQAMNAGFDESTQVTLFGEEHLVASLFSERAKVLDTTLKTLRRDRSVFNSLNENRAQIEAEGNVLDAAQNRTRSEIDAQAITVIQKAANRKGELSDALSAAAKQFKETGNAAGAARAFTDAVRRAVERGDLDGAELGDGGRVVDVAPESYPVAASPARESLDAFDDPVSGDGVARQADQLENDFRTAVERNEDAIAKGVIIPDYRPYLHMTDDSIEVPLSAIKPIRAREDGIANAEKFMAASARGEGEGRGPISLRDDGDGTYTLLDGNSTYAVASKAGMPVLPARILTDEQFRGEVATKHAKLIMELGPNAKKKRVVLAGDLEPAHLESLELTLKTGQGYLSIDDIITRNTGFNKVLNDAVEDATGEHIVVARGPLKERDRIEAKVNGKYQGELNYITDVSRSTVVVARPSEADEFIANLGKRFHVVDEGWQGPLRGTNEYVGYFDKKIAVISDDGLIGEVIVVERGMYDAKGLGGHSYYEIMRGDPLGPAIAGLPDGPIKTRLLTAFENGDVAGAELIAKTEATKLYESVHPTMDGDFRQVAGTVLGSAPETSALILNSASDSSGVRVSARSSLADISPQVDVETFQINAVPSSRSTAGKLPSSEKNLIDDSIEQTAAGDQTLIPGVEPITDRARAEAALGRPLHGGNKPADFGLFDEGQRLQNDLLDMVPDLDRVELDPTTGELTPVMRSARDLLDEIDQDARMLKSFETCSL